MDRRTMLKAAGTGAMAAAGICATTPAGAKQVFLAVDASVPDDHDSIQAAVDAVDPGGTVVVSADRTGETVELGKAVSVLGDAAQGSASTEPGAPDGSPILDGGGIDQPAFTLTDGVSSVTVRGFDLTGYREAIRANGSTEDVTVRDVTSTNPQTGFLIGGDPSAPDTTHLHTRWTIEHNDIRSPSASGLQAFNLQQTTIQANRVTTADGATPAYGISVYTDGDAVSDLSITGNDIDGNFGGAAIGCLGPLSPSGTGTLSEIEIADNAIIATTAYHVLVSTSGDGTVSNLTIADNELRGDTTEGIRLFVTHQGSMSDVEIRDNSLVGIADAGPAIHARTIEETSIDSITIVGNEIRENERGISIENQDQSTADDILIEDSDIVDNTEAGILVDANPTGERVIVLQNTIAEDVGGNEQTFGIRNDGPGDVTAVNNWWGSMTGPQHMFNLSGTGARVSDGVTFSPWIGQDYIDDDLEVQTTGLLNAIDDWRGGVIDTTVLLTAIDHWRSGDPVA